MTTEQTVRIFKIVKTRIGCFVARIGNEAIGIEQTGWTDKLIRIPPERRARSRTAGAKNALLKAVQFLAVFR
jgi:hypothetical protein